MVGEFLGRMLEIILGIIFMICFVTLSMKLYEFEDEFFDIFFETKKLFYKNNKDIFEFIYRGLSLVIGFLLPFLPYLLIMMFLFDWLG